MAHLVYILCALISALCTYLLWKRYRLSRNSLLFWSAVCFFGFFVSNIMLVLNNIIFPDINLRLLRLSPILLGLLALIYGLIFKVER
jgi:hypothetical protein